MSERRSGAWAAVFCAALANCGAKTPLRVPVLDALESDAVDASSSDAIRREICSNGVDDNGDGRIDEGCPTCLRAGASPWQQHAGGGVQCFGRTFASNGDPGEYAFTTIPAATDPGWVALSSVSVDFRADSTLCGAPCECRAGADFTFFQTSVFLPDGFAVRSFVASIAVVDDGARVTVFNSRFPAGNTDPGAFATLLRGTTADLGPLLAPGENRVVITHIDDCCLLRSLVGVRLLLNDGALTQCR